ncbi:MAG: pitrilysin family protein [Eubacteriales bacterium]|nr:pitrilysin family protein [Eubacteriales bacterium]MDD3349573.1 pitrilysin family protein [Eubacteriales bacterium]
MIKKKTLQNGTRIILEKIPSVQSVSVGIWVRAGSIDEKPENLGISHLIEHMLFKGTEKRTSKQIAEDLDRIGVHSNAFTSKECTCYYVKTLESNVEKACEILTDMFMNSTFDVTEFEKEKAVIFEEIKMIEDSPEDDAHDQLTEMVFRGTPLESPIIGTTETLSSIDRDMVVNYLHEQYSADSIVVSVAGSFDEDKICELFEKALINLKPDKTKKQAGSAIYVPEYRSKVKEVEQSHLCFGIKSVPHEDELYYTMVLLNSIVGGSMSSRLFQNIREEKGLAYSVYSSVQAYVADGIFSIYAGVSHEKVKDTIAAVSEELRALKTSGVTLDELEIAKEQFKSSYAFSQENVSSRMFSNGKNLLLRGNYMTPKEVIGKVDAVDMDKMTQAFQKIIDLDQYCGIVIGNKEHDLKDYVKGI